MLDGLCYGLGLALVHVAAFRDLQQQRIAERLCVLPAVERAAAALLRQRLAILTVVLRIESDFAVAQLAATRCRGDRNVEVSHGVARQKEKSENENTRR
ncbi:MAG: hypothetical protein E5X83_17455 [Mesorhizobium sp.]|nr:MAG: hypothetical protein EOR82_19795 [Mesorhizobium sp.]TIO24185.1 MAG: hypothetical protein E5X83_17455 [Mesorhizobium sp.]TJV64201.1 MAG: hypothetical protein E5X82_00205 [Mesorhizobium sp.]